MFVDPVLPQELPAVFVAAVEVLAVARHEVEGLDELVAVATVPRVVGTPLSSLVSSR